MKTYFAFVVVGVVSVSGLAWAQAPAETTAHVIHRNTVVDQNAKFDYAGFDAILNANVVGDKVDYLNIRKSWMPQLRSYLDRIAEFDADSLEPNEKLALYINLYNATMIHTIVERFHAGYSCTEDNKKIFNEPLVRVSKETISLNYLEHKLIRGTFQDPRVHAALVCGGLGCPPLSKSAYRGDLLPGQLDAAMKVWVTDASRNVVDEKNKTVVLSKLFRSYAVDFGGEEKAIATVDQYHPADFSKYKVTFDENYDWSLNILPPRYGKWVTLTQAIHENGVDCPATAVLEMIEELESGVSVRVNESQVAVIPKASTRPYPDAVKK